MGEFKFACPFCGQHLSCDEGYAGLQISCPACQRTVVIPATPQPSATQADQPIQSPPRTVPPASRPNRGPVRGARTSGLAIASLICSCAGLIFGYLGTIPGIICALKAHSQIKRNPGLGGKGLATTGLITGCVLSLIWIPMTYILVVATTSAFHRVAVIREAQAETKRIEAQFKADDGIEMDTKPDGSGWTFDLEGVSIPDTPVSGRVQGVSFKPKGIEFDSTFTTFKFSYDNFDRVVAPNTEESITLSLRFDEEDAAQYSGRTFEVRKDNTVSIQPQGIWSLRTPSLRIDCKVPGERLFSVWGDEIKYAMRLEFGELKNGKLPGRIYLCVLDRKKSFIRGTFVANVKRNTSVALQQQPMRGFVNSPTNIAPDAAGWTLELANVTIPDTPATGRLHGFAFKVEQARMRVGASFDQTGKQVGDALLLELREGKDFFADRQISVSISELSLARLSGQTIRWPSDDPNRYRPLVDMEWKIQGQHFAEHARVQKFVMRVEFGELKGSQLSGRIYLCVLDSEKSFVCGTFLATVQKSSGGPGTMPQPPRRIFPAGPGGGLRPVPGPRP